MSSEGDGSSRVAQIKVVSPIPNVKSPLEFKLPFECTIKELKTRISEAVESRPEPSAQKLIYRGKILADTSTITSILAASANGESSEQSSSATFHLVVAPSRSSPAATPGAPQLNSANLQSTLFGGTNNTANILRNRFQASQNAAPAPASEGAALATGTSETTGRAGMSLAQTFAQLRNPRAVMQPPINLANGTSAGPARVVSTTTATIRLGDPSALQQALGPRVVTVGTQESYINPTSDNAAPTATTTVYDALESNIPSNISANEVSSRLRMLEGNAEVMAAVRNAQADPERQLYLIVGPDGQHALLQRDSRSAGPSYAPVDPQTVLTGEVAGGLDDQEMIRRIVNHYNGGARDLNRTLEQLQEQVLARRGQGGPQMALRRENIMDIVRRVQEGGNHFWLFVRLVIFIMLFSTNASWQRKITMITTGLVIFVWQTGILNTYFRNGLALYHELFPPAPQQPMARHPPHAPAPGAAPLDPAATAELLIARDNERRAAGWRARVGVVERVVTTFLTSLVPGMHDLNGPRAPERPVQAEPPAAGNNEPPAEANAADGAQNEAAAAAADVAIDAEAQVEVNQEEQQQQQGAGGIADGLGVAADNAAFEGLLNVL